MTSTIPTFIQRDKLPKHVAIIMDGNGRWAKQSGMPRVFGHKNGVKAVRAVTESAAELGIEYLTLYAFSTENWNRPKSEVTALMTLLVETIYKEIKTLHKNNIRLLAIGDLKKLPEKTYKALMEGIESTKNNTRMSLVLALNYSSKWEIVEAVKQIAQDYRDNRVDMDAINSDLFASYLSTRDIPDPELLIRTSGENRLSNFLLWQLAYSEFYFTSVFWPEFDKEEFYKAIYSYQNRERRFGMTGEQVLKNNI